MNNYSTEELENLIRKYIKFWYNAEYKGLLRVEKIITTSQYADQDVLLLDDAQSTLVVDRKNYLAIGDPATSTFYNFIIGIPSYMAPTQIAIDCNSDDEFLNYIYSELRSRNYIRLDIYKTLRTNDSREE